MKARILTVVAVALLLATTGCRGGLCGSFFGRGASCGGPDFGPQYNIAPPAPMGSAPCGSGCGCGPNAGYSAGMPEGYDYDGGGYIDGSAVGGGVLNLDGWNARSNYGFQGEQIVPGSMHTSPSTSLSPVISQ